MKAYDKKDFPLDKIRRFLEPGPVVLVSSAWKDETNIMTRDDPKEGIEALPCCKPALSVQLFCVSR